MLRKLLVVSFALVVLAAAPAAAQYSGGTLVLSASAVQPGGSIEVSCTGLAPDAAYTVTFDGAEVDRGVTDANGSVGGTFTVGASTAPGVYELAVVTADGRCVANVEVRGAVVVGAQPTPTNGFTPGPGSGGGNGGSAGTGGSGSAGSGSGSGSGGTRALAQTGSSDGLRTAGMVGAGLVATGGMALLSARRRRIA